MHTGDKLSHFTVSKIDNKILCGRLRTSPNTFLAVGPAYYPMVSAPMVCFLIRHTVCL